MSVSEVCIQLSSAHNERVGVVLDVGLQAAVLIGDELLAVGLEIAVGVAGEPQVGRFGDEHAAIEDLQRARQDQLVEEDGLLVHLPVAVAIFEHADAAQRFVLGRCGDVLHIADHLDDPEPALRIPIDEDWLLDHRFAGHELDVIPRRHRERLHLVGGREDGRLGRRRVDRGRPATLFELCAVAAHRRAAVCRNPAQRRRCERDDGNSKPKTTQPDRHGNIVSSPDVAPC